MSTSTLHSVVVPMYDEELVAEEFYRRTTAALSSVGEYEIVAVDDGSRDETFAILARLAEADPRLKIVRLARNFGHQTATMAGIDLAAGETVTVIDADLQDPPEVIPEMIARWREGADIVFAVRESRAGESAFKKATAAAYYRLLQRLAEIDIPVDTGDFRLMSRRAVEGLCAMREHNRYVRGLAGWMGLRREVVTYHRDARYAGTSKYPLKRMLRLAFDGVLSFSTGPLRIATFLGGTAASVALVVLLWALGLRLFTQTAVPGWASLMVSVLFIGGVQLLTTGIIGEYLGRVYDEVRHRPSYLVDEVRGFGRPVAEHFQRSPLPLGEVSQWQPTQR